MRYTDTTCARLPPRRCVDLRHGEGLAALREHIEHGAARARQTQTSAREKVRQRLPDVGGRPKAHMQLICILDSTI